MWKSGFVLLAAALLTGWPALAQPAGTGTPAAIQLTLPEVLQAVRAGPDVRLSESALAAARSDIATANHAPIPQLTAKMSELDLQNGLGPGNLFADKRIDKSLGVDWTLERGNKRALRKRSAELAADAARFDLGEAVVQQQIAASSAFYDLLAAQERVSHVAAVLASAEQLSGASRRRLQAGDASRQDSLRTEVEAERARADLRQAEADRHRAVAALRALLGLPGELAAQGGWPPLATATPAIADPEERNDVRAARQRVESAQVALDNALALRKNDVTVGASVDHYPGTSTRLLEVRMQMPLAGILGSYDYQGEIGRAQATLAQAQNQLDKTRRAAVAESQRLAQDLASAASRAGSFEAAIVPRAREVASMAELAYAKGAMSLTELIDARRTLRAVLLDDVAAKADYARALAAWQLRAGAPSP
jgi:outer membrane protein, heavy metal efflux system